MIAATVFFSLSMIPETAAMEAEIYDLVMDPETGLDAVHNVGVKDGKVYKNTL